MSMDAYSYVFVGAPIDDIPVYADEDIDFAQFAEEIGLYLFDTDCEGVNHIGMKIAALDSLQTKLVEIAPEDIDEGKEAFLKALAKKGITSVHPGLYLSTSVCTFNAPTTDFTKRAIDLTVEEKMALVGAVLYTLIKKALEEEDYEGATALQQRWAKLHPDGFGFQSLINMDFQSLFTWRVESRLNVKECTVQELVENAYPHDYTNILSQACDVLNETS